MDQDESNRGNLAVPNVTSIARAYARVLIIYNNNGGNARG